LGIHGKSQRKDGMMESHSYMWHSAHGGQIRFSFYESRPFVSKMELVDGKMENLASLVAIVFLLFFFLIFSQFYYLSSFSIPCLFVLGKFSQSREVCFRPLEMVSFGRRELIEILKPFFFFGNGSFFKKRFE
jgi:hypothetical protein